MIRFAALFAAIDGTTATSAKVEAMAAYFAAAPPADAAWAVFFLTGRRLKRLVPGRAVSAWTLAATGLPEWLLGECYAVVGDGAETAALVLDQLPAAPGDDRSLAEWMHTRILPLREAAPDVQRARVIGWLRGLGRWERFTMLKLLTGELRVGVSQTLVVRALAQASRLAPTAVAARLMGEWTPTADWYTQLVAAGESAVDQSRPYPFCLASPLDPDVDGPARLDAVLGDRSGWQAEWKWDGIRAQLVKRGTVHLWSRGEELITARFPEIVAAGETLPDGTVLDGEVLAWEGDRPLPFSALQRRIGRRRQVAQAARNVPVVFLAFDVLERHGVDVRGEPLDRRREWLAGAIAAVVTTARRAGPPVAEARLPLEPEAVGADRPVLRLSPVDEAPTWTALAARREESRARGVEGLMLKRRDSVYGTGRRRGDWWKWKIEPFTIDAVLLYAQPGSGKRASLLTDYTFGVWHEGALVPVAKAYSGLTNDEIAELDRWIRRHTRDRFGPVRHVEPVQVFELGFEAIARSTRHRSGIAVRFPRMLRWRSDKLARDADTLDALRRLLEQEEDRGRHGR
jgi:DNA ligase-1